MAILGKIARTGGIVADRMANPIHNAADTSLRVARGMVKVTPGGVVKNAEGKFERETGKIELTKKGIATVGVLGAIGSATQGLAGIQQSRMGTFSPAMETSTPSYINNGGATGDLAFALHRNRRG